MAVIAFVRSCYVVTCVVIAPDRWMDGVVGSTSGKRQVWVGRARVRDVHQRRAL